ncbi:hypothetical protein THAOC_03897 [Thalassiosira oceanica]|uniref:Subtilisin n=1 Tax=Thalassiosira oceanica TaxID=159749 RepID=K0TBA5_THAOC|nr:hypothetical protein THAOC_03897 [Thalassiosira oceanica]|eukprot:EJK74424.1 hypothetical protein THAOC_03897 [Thalassiosira oceanica]
MPAVIDDAGRGQDEPPVDHPVERRNSRPFFDEGLDGRIRANRRRQSPCVADGGLDADNCYLADTSVERINGPDRWNLNHRKVVRYDDSFGDRLEREAGHGTCVSVILSGRRLEGTDDNESGTRRRRCAWLEAGLLRHGGGKPGHLRPRNRAVAPVAVQPRRDFGSAGPRREREPFARGTAPRCSAAGSTRRRGRHIPTSPSCGKHGAGRRGLEHTEPGRLQELARVLAPMAGTDEEGECDGWAQPSDQAGFSGGDGVKYTTARYFYFLSEGGELRKRQEPQRVETRSRTLRDACVMKPADVARAPAVEERPTAGHAFPAIRNDRDYVGLSERAALQARAQRVNGRRVAGVGPGDEHTQQRHRDSRSLSTIAKKL